MDDVRAKEGRIDGLPNFADIRCLKCGKGEGFPKFHKFCRRNLWMVPPEMHDLRGRILRHRKEHVSLAERANNVR